MTVDRIGYGAGQKDFPHPNILRILIGEVAGEVASATGIDARNNPAHRPRTESIIILESNLDNATGETIGHAVDRLWAAGALDVSLTPIQMKKGRPGILISVQARLADANNLEAILFRDTPTLGVRRTNVLRTVLARDERKVETAWGPIAGKLIYLPDGSQRFSPEFEACRQLAELASVSLADVMVAAQQAFCNSKG
jgi:hypothetical protein